MLVLEAAEPLRLAAGRLGPLTVSPGRYAYFGSALGPGGIAARVERHLRPADSRRAHWHIDYLTAVLPITGMVSVTSEERLECAWVRLVAALPGAAIPIKGFGSTDCREGCSAHLVQLPEGVALEQLEELLCHSTT
jgi:Uri superfamily endonuclease